MVEDGGPAWLQEHARILDRLEVERDRLGERWQVRRTEEQARSFQLMHVLPHELGHHRDRMTTRSKARAARGELYAERYACEVFERLAP